MKKRRDINFTWDLITSYTRYYTVNRGENSGKDASIKKIVIIILSWRLQGYLKEETITNLMSLTFIVLDTAI